MNSSADESDTKDYRRPTNVARRIKITALVKVETDKAFLLILDDLDGNTIEVWIPKSQIDKYICEEDLHISGTIPEWLAKDKKLI